MHSIDSVISDAMSNGNLYQDIKFVQVAVFKDGTMEYYQDGRGNSKTDIKTSKEALEAAGLNVENPPLYFLQMQIGKMATSFILKKLNCKI